MKLTYLSDSEITVRSFLVPAARWNTSKAKSRRAEQEEWPEIPEWQKRLLEERMEAYRNGLEAVFDAEEVFAQIEKDLS